MDVGKEVDMSELFSKGDVDVLSGHVHRKRLG
jgi:hypothetical protein